MKRLVEIISLLIISSFLIFVLPKISIVKSNDEKFISPLPPANPVNIVMDNPSELSTAPFPTGALFKRPVNILLIGLDGRKGDGKPRCDAIQMISYNMQTGIIVITSVPRGTIIDIPDTDSSSSYLANSCHIMGMDFAIKNIERITGIHPDYLIRIGFSQTLGILRNLGIPEISALQYLRNRSVAYGDYQRTHNQALFIKDMIIKYLGTVSNVPKPFRYILYRLIDTNMPYETADTILSSLVKSEIYKHPEKIILATKPENSYNIKDNHFNPILPTGNISSDSDYQNYQNTIDAYISSLIEKGEKYIRENNFNRAYQTVYTPFIQRIWEQVNETNTRNEYHFKILEIFILSNPNKSQLRSLILDYTTEMEILGYTDFQKRGEELLKIIN